MQQTEIHGPGGEPSKFRGDIEGLRGVAVLAVLIDHLGLDLLPYGFLGVDVFFVISGFVIARSVIDWDWTKFWPNASHFFARRFKRLAPALFVCLLLSSLVGSFFIQDMEDNTKTAFWASVGLSNFFFYNQQFDYFGRLLDLNLFTHTWSLGVEEQFYILFPLAAWLSLSAALPRRVNLISITVLAVFCLASLGAYMMYAKTDPVGTFYMIYFRAWELGLGVAIAVLIRHWRPQRFNSLIVPVCLGLLLILFALQVDLNRNFATVIAVVLSATLLLFPVRTGTFSKALSNTPLRWVGKISYSLYLWHWPVAVLAKWTIGLTAITAPFFVLVMFGAATLSYRFVENPLRHSKWTAARMPGYLVGSSALVTTLIAIWVLSEDVSRNLYSGVSPALAQRGPATLEAPLKANDGSVWQGRPCIIRDATEVGRSIPIEGCVFGSWETAEKRILVVGNSFSVAFGGAFREISETEDWAVLLTSSWGAQPVPELGYNGPWKEANQHYWEDAVPELVRELRAGDVVLMLSDLGGLSYGSGGKDDVVLQRYLEGIQRFARELNEQDISLAIVGPLPLVREARCTPEVAVAQWFAPNGGPCHYLTREQTLKRVGGVRTELSTLEENETAIFVDLFDFYCPGPVCNYFGEDGIVLYRDEHSHSSLEAATSSASLMVKKLKENRH